MLICRGQTFKWNSDHFVALATIQGKILLDPCSPNPTPQIECFVARTQNELNQLSNHFVRVNESSFLPRSGGG